MSGADWVSAHEAQCRAKDAGFTADDLLEWARQGRLRTRAKSRVDSDDVSPPNLWLECVITHPEEPPADEGARHALGQWPDVPADFWAEQPAKANWGAGTFANKVHYFSKHHQELTYSFIELFDVTFHTGDLGALLTATMHIPVTEPICGVLPTSAKPNDRLYERHAHRAAELVRSQNIKPSEAFRRVLKHEPPAPHLRDTSQETALRKAYGTMYDELGMPHPK